MDFLNNLWDTVRGIAPTIAGTLATTATGNPILGGAVSAAVRGILGKPDDGSPIREDEAQEIVKNPELYLKLRTMLQNMELKKLQEETKRMEIVNQTMQAEAMSESKAQRGWRPYNGYLFGTTLFCDYFVAQIVLALAKSQIVWTHIPSEVYLLWSAVLGVTVASRGVEKIAKTSPISGLAGILKSSFGK